MLFPIAAAAAGCSNDRPFGRESTRIVDGPDHGPSPASVVAASEAFPHQSCVDREVANARLVEVAGVAPEGWRKTPKPQDEGWYPGELVDVAVLPDGFALLDGRGDEVTRFSKDFTHRVQWGRSGQGPAEFRDPSALAYSPSSGELWVLNGRPPRLVAFDSLGHVVRTIALRRGGNDLVIDSEGRFYVAHSVSRARAKTGSDWAALVSVIGPDGTPEPDLVRVSEQNWKAPRMWGPVEVRVKLAVSGRRVAVLYFPTGVADIYEGGKLQSTFRVCIPEDLREAYDRQLGDLNASSQSNTFLLNDVAFDTDGTAYVVGSLADSAGRFHIDMFDQQGRARGSIVLPAKGMSLLSSPTFAGDIRHVVSYNPTGAVALFAVEGLREGRQ